VAAERRPEASRLSCQLLIHEDGDEIEVEIPDRQV
jgi:ferredoxin